MYEMFWFWVTTPGVLLSVPFLIATFLVYAILPELRNVHGKSLMCYLAGLSVGYMLLGYMQLYGSIFSPWCRLQGYLMYFSFMVSFFWLNVISFDLWWNFRYVCVRRVFVAAIVSVILSVIVFCFQSFAHPDHYYDFILLTITIPVLFLIIFHSFCAPFGILGSTRTNNYTARSYTHNTPTCCISHRKVTLSHLSEASRASTK